MYHLEQQTLQLLAGQLARNEVGFVYNEEKFIND
jgi:hypothetical protein